MDEVYISLLVVSVGTAERWRGGGIFSCIMAVGVMGREQRHSGARWWRYVSAEVEVVMVAVIVMIFGRGWSLCLSPPCLAGGC